MNSKLKEIFLPLVFIFLLLLGIKELSMLYEYWAYWEPPQWSSIFGSGIFGITLIYFSYKFLKVKEWIELIIPSMYLFLGFSLQCFSSIYHLFEYTKGNYPWLTSGHIMGSYFQIVLLTLTGIIAIFLCFRIIKLKRNEKLEINRISPTFSLIPLFYGLFVFVKASLFFIVFNSQPYWHKGMEIRFEHSDLIHMIFYFLLSLSLILLTLFKKRIDLVKIPLIGFFTFYGLTEFLYPIINPFAYLLLLVVGTISITLAFLILNLDIEEIKDLLTERYKIT